MSKLKINFKLGNCWFTLFKSKSGEISPNPTWVCIYGDCYMQTNDNLIKLIIEVFKEFKDDKHLVG